MAAYAALVSLMNIMENIQIHPRVSTYFDKNQIESFGGKVEVLLDFVESDKSDGGISKEEVEDLESQIASAAHGAEDAIESYMVDRIHDGSAEESCSFLLDLQKIMADMDSIHEKVSLRAHQQPKSAMPAASPRPRTTENTTMVGFDGYLIQLLDWLTAGQQSDMHMISITGMGGIGKTTLARNLYEDSLIVHHFDVRAWVTISQDYNVNKVLLEILSCLGFSTNKDETEDELGLKLHKVLFGRRYVVVLDDMWSIEAWFKIKFYFPENDGSSRIVVTTRQMDVASHCGPLGLALDFLDDDTSWNLFCQKAFAQESCPLEFEVIGKEIVRKCRGLPLSISVIGGLLGKSSRMPENWEKVAKDFSSLLNSAEDNQCLNVLSLSYDYLPAYLKPCFLYLGIFPEDHSIGVSRLINLWIAEGFLKPQKEQCLEDVAYGYLKDLVDRNLIILRRLTSLSEKVKICNIHDLVRDLCLKVTEKEKFFCILQKTCMPHIDLEHRIIINEDIWSNKYSIGLCNALTSASVARSLIGKNKFTGLLKSRLLRVLSPYYGDPFDTTLKPLNLRFLDYYYIGNDHGPYKLPSSISLFWNLQTLVITDVDGVNRIVAPSEIWEMPQLRHLRCRVYLPDPPQSESRDYIVMQNLQTLKLKLSVSFREEVCRRIPNIKKLCIFCLDKLGEDNILSNYSLHNIGSFNKLESLRLSCLEVNRGELLQYFKFPTSLRKLCLDNCQLHWDDLTILIGSLPRLEVLDLYSVEGHEWSPLKGNSLA